MVEARLVETKPNVELTMPYDVAATLYAVLGQVAGEGQLRRDVDQIYGELSRAGFDLDKTISRRLTGTINAGY